MGSETRRACTVRWHRIRIPPRHDLRGRRWTPAAHSVSNDDEVDGLAISPTADGASARRVSKHPRGGSDAPTPAARLQTRATESFNASRLNGGRSSRSDHPRARLRRVLGNATSGGELACARKESRRADRATESASYFRSFQEYVEACLPPGNQGKP